MRTVEVIWTPRVGPQGEELFRVNLPTWHARLDTIVAQINSGGIRASDDPELRAIVPGTARREGEAIIFEAELEQEPEAA